MLNEDYRDMLQALVDEKVRFFFATCVQNRDVRRETDLLFPVLMLPLLHDSKRGNQDLLVFLRAAHGASSHAGSLPRVVFLLKNETGFARLRG